MPARPLHTDDDFLRAARLPREVYQGNPCWTPPPEDQFIDELAGRIPHAAYSQIQTFAAEQGGRFVSTVTAVLDSTYNRHWNERLGHLLMFEALPGCEDEVQDLLRFACAWLRERGSDAVRASFLPGLQLPLTIDAYDAVPTIFHGYNPPYYHSYWKNAGFVTERGLVEYRVRFTPGLAARYREMVAQAERSGCVLRPWDFTELDRETQLFTDLLAETFAQHWGAPELPYAVMSGLTHGLRDELVPSFCQFAAVGGEPAGFVYSLPDLNQPSPRTHGVLLIIGVRRPYRGRGVNLALAARSYLAMIEHGCQSASYTVVLDDNWPSRRTAEKLGARVERNFIVYRKELAG